MEKLLGFDARALKLRRQISISEKECAAIEAELINYPKIINFNEPTPRVIKVVGNVKGCLMFL